MLSKLGDSRFVWDLGYSNHDRHVVRLQDRGSTSIFGCHYDEGRITRVADGDPILAELAKCSIDRYAQIERVSGIPFYSRNGYLTVEEYSGGGMIKSISNATENVGAKPILMNSIEAKATFPYFKFQEDVGMVFDPIGGNISPRRLVSAHKKAASVGGCDIVCDVVADVKHRDGYIIVSTETGKTYQTRKVLVATGAFTQFRNLLPTDKTLDVRLKTQTVLKLQIDNEEATRLYNMPSLGILQRTKDTSTFARNRNLKCYVLPPVKYPNGEWYLKLGHGAEGEVFLDNEKEIARWYRGNGSPWSAKNLYDIILSIIPDLKYKNLETDCCMTTQTKTGYVYIDMVTSNLGIALGGNGNAAKMSDELGHIAARMIIKGGWDYHIPSGYFKAAYKSQTVTSSRL